MLAGKKGSYRLCRTPGNIQLCNHTNFIRRLEWRWRRTPGAKWTEQSPVPIVSLVLMDTAAGDDGVPLSAIDDKSNQSRRTTSSHIAVNCLSKCTIIVVRVRNSLIRSSSV